MVQKRHDVDGYFSLKRILMLSLAIVLAYYAMFTIIHYFSRFSFFNSNTIEERIHKEQERRQMLEAIRFDTIQGHTEGSLVSRQRIGESKDDINKGGKGYKRPRLWAQLMLNIPITFILVFLVLLYNRRIMSIGFKRLRDEVVVNVLGSAVITIAISTAGTFIQIFVWPDFPGLPHSIYRFLRLGWTNDLTLTSVAMVTGYLFRSLNKEKMVAVENEVLRAENIRTRYEALKTQLDPHFLFNSMNTLQSLITVDPERAEEFVQQLSTVLRYTLQKHEVVTLAEELRCTADYCRMLKIRYGDNLLFDHHIDHEKFDECLVLPLSIQGLVENAIKHNVVSARQPLTVHISTDENAHLIVSNKIQPKITEEEGSGIGLANLAERYRLQWDKTVEIRDDGNEFIVILPLVEN